MGKENCMRLEQINLLEVETQDGFLDIIDLEDVKSVNVLCDYAVVSLRNGMFKCVVKEYADTIKKLIKRR
jgi:hypothetical protein